MANIKADLDERISQLEIQFSFIQEYGIEGEPCFNLDEIAFDYAIPYGPIVDEYKRGV